MTILLKELINNLYDHKEDIDENKIFIIVKKSNNEELARFTISQILSVPANLLERVFRGSKTTYDKKQTTLFVE